MMIPTGIKALILDLDGVLWTENKPIGDLHKIFATIESRSLKVTLVTNNSTKTPLQYIEKLNQFGVIWLRPEQVITSALALAEELDKSIPGKGIVFVIGEEGLRAALIDQGFRISTGDLKENVVAVVVGIDREVNFEKLRQATLFIRKGIPFYGTNPDKTFPTPEGLILGTGALLALLTTATDVEPNVVGKPSPTMIQLARKRMSVTSEETLVIGDRPETDICAGQADGSRTALVLSGVTSAEQAKLWKPAPTLIAKDLSDLLDL